MKYSVRKFFYIKNELQSILEIPITASLCLSVQGT